VFLAICLSFNSYCQLTQTANKTQHINFIENKGQWPQDVRFLAKFNGLSLWITSDAILFDFFISEKIEINSGKANATFLEYNKGHILKLEFESSNPASIEIGKNVRKEYYNYFFGNNPDCWQTKVSAYSEVIIKNLYDGIDLRLYDSCGLPRFDFLIDDMALVSQIKMIFTGQDNMRIKTEGEIILATSIGEISIGDINAFKLNDGLKEKICCDLKKLKDWKLGFECKNRDKNNRIIIDPVIYATFLGGNDYEEGDAVVIDKNENAYVIGSTKSSSYPTTTGAYTTSFQGLPYDVFYSKIDSTGSNLIYSTFLGGSGLDYGISISLDQNNNVYLGGRTESNNFPVSSSAFQKSKAGGADDGFIAKLNSSGTSLVYSTYIGGNFRDRTNYIIVDSSGFVYATGWTESTNFPTTSSAFNKTCNGSYDGWFAQFNTTGSALVFSTYFGGSDLEEPLNMILSDTGTVTIVGYTFSNNFPTSSGAYQTTYGGNTDGFIISFNSTGSNIQFSTYLGKGGQDIIYDIAEDKRIGNNKLLICGTTSSGNFPTLSSSLQPSFNGVSDAFLLWMNSNGSAFLNGTFMGGNAADDGRSVSIDSIGNVYFGGFTSSYDFPVNLCAPQPYFGGGSTDIFLAKVNNALSVIYSSTYFGGNDADQLLRDIYVSSVGMIWFTGRTWSKNYPTTANSYSPVFNGGSNDALLTKFNVEPLVIITGSVKPTLCINSKQILSFSINCKFISNNIFTAQLSDSNGNFNNPLSIGTLNSDSAGIIIIQIPDTVKEASGYRVRVVSSNPPVTGTDNGMDIKLTHGPEAWFTVNDSIQCKTGNSFRFSNLSYYYDGTFTSTWYFGDGTTSGNKDVQHSYNDTGCFHVKLIVTAIDGCSDSFIINVYVNENPKADFTINKQFQCLQGNSFQFSNTSKPSASALTTFWRFGDSNTSTFENPSHSYNKADSFKVVLVVSQDSSCTDSTYKMVYVVKNPAVPVIKFNPPLCEGSDVILYSDSIALAAYNWTSSVGISDSIRILKINKVQTTHSGKYSLIITVNNCQSPQSDTIINITPLPSRPIIEHKSAACEGDSLILFALPATDTFIWVLPDKTSLYKPSYTKYPLLISDTGYYYLYRLSKGCRSMPDSMHIIVNPYPPSPVVSDSIVCCRKEQIQLTASDIAGASYQWRGPFNFKSNQQNPTINTALISNTGYYYVYASLGGCNSKESKTFVRVWDLPYPSLGNDTTLCPVTDSFVLFPGFFSTYLWQDFSTKSTFLVIQQGVYTVLVSNSHNCKSSDTIFIEAYCDPVINIPNTFTPNGDGLNDSFSIFGEYYDEVNMMIFNRWGELIYQSKNNKPYWDGNYHGNKCMEGVYYYSVIIRYKKTKSKNYFGTVTLLR